MHNENRIWPKKERSKSQVNSRCIVLTSKQWWDIWGGLCVHVCPGHPSDVSYLHYSGWDGCFHPELCLMLVREKTMCVSVFAGVIPGTQSWWGSWQLCLYVVSPQAWWAWSLYLAQTVHGQTPTYTQTNTAIIKIVLLFFSNKNTGRGQNITSNFIIIVLPVFWTT